MSKYPNAFYRVSVKALIRNTHGHILVCKEASDHWSLPGGGIDHGEEPEAALIRELYEELKITGVKIKRLITAIPFFVKESDRYQMWLVYETSADESSIKVADAHEFMFIDPEEFKNSTLRSEKLAYRAANS